MRNYVIRRLLTLLPTLFFASLIVVFAIRMIPGDVIDLMLSQNDVASDADRAQLQAALGFDQPAIQQYGKWVFAAMQGDEIWATVGDGVKG